MYGLNAKHNIKSWVLVLLPIPVSRKLRRLRVCLFLPLLILFCGFLVSPVCAQECPQSILFADDFESDPSARWTISREGTNPLTFVARDWTWVQSLPDGRSGSAFFAPDPVRFDLCSSPPPGQVGVLLLQSPAITLPGDLPGKLRVSFDHWVSLEEGFDGAQLMISVNGGPYFLVGSESNADFISNPYNFVLFAFGGEGKNPRFGQPAWSGVGGGLPDNSWGTTIVDLTRFAQPGDTIRLRWDMSTDYCFGTDAGWYVDNVKVYTCPVRTLSGVVTGNGAPLAGINVTAYRFSSDSSYWEPAQSTVTGPDGGYALSLLAGTYRIGFIDLQGPYGTLYFDGANNVDQADDVVVGSVDVGNINGNMILNHPITGRVTVDGVNMPNVFVTAWRRLPNGIDWEAVKTATTGLDGTYALYLLDGTYRIEFKTWQGRFGPGYYDGAYTLETATDVVVAGAEVPNINGGIVSPDPNTGPAITGTVIVAGTGAPAGGIQVTARIWNGEFWAAVRSAETQLDGTYALYVPEGTYRVEFRHILNLYSGVFYDGAATVDAASDVIVPTAGAPNINAQLVENHYITGTITADVVPGLPPGPPPTSITAWWWNAPHYEWDQVGGATSAPDGTYVLYVPDGTYRIEFRALGPYYPTYYDGADTLAEAADVTVTGGNVSNINSHLRRIVFADPWPPATSLSRAGQDAWDPQVAAGPDGAVTAVWYRRDGRDSRIQVATAAPNQYWSPPADLSLPGEDASDPQVAMGPRGTALVVWRQWDGAHYRVQASNRGENGKWSAPVNVSKAGEDAWDPQVAMGPHGMAVVAWRRSDGTNHQVQASTRVAYGPWSSPVMLSTVGGDAWDPRLSVGSDGTATVVWSRSDGTNERVQATTREPNGSWSSPVTLSDAGADGLNPHVVVGSDGAATAVWRSWDGSSDRIQTSTRAAKGLWSTPASLSTVSGNVYDPEVAVDAEGMVTAVWGWWDGAHGQVQAASRPPGGTWSRPVTLSSCCDDAQNPRVAAGPDGRATAVWRAPLYGVYEHMVAATRTPDGSWSAPIVVSEDSLHAYGGQVAAGSDGTVAAVWERREGSDDRVQAVLIPAPESRRKP